MWSPSSANTDIIPGYKTGKINLNIIFFYLFLFFCLVGFYTSFPPYVFQDSLTYELHMSTMVLILSWLIFCNHYFLISIHKVLSWPWGVLDLWGRWICLLGNYLHYIVSPIPQLNLVVNATVQVSLIIHLYLPPKLNCHGYLVYRCTW